jgi:putative endonuclease
MSYFAYILKSDYDGSYYYGSTRNIEERLKDHNKGKSTYTKGRRPWKINYTEEFQTKSEAMKIEKFFKSIGGYNFLKKNNII